jgi:hypothetical protein
MILKKIEGHFESTMRHNKHIVSFSIAESATMVIVLIVQLFYIKNLVEKHNIY